MRHAVSWTYNFRGSTSLESLQLPKFPWMKHTEILQDDSHRQAASGSDRDGAQNTLNSRTPEPWDRLIEALLVLETRNFFLPGKVPQNLL